MGKGLAGRTYEDTFREISTLLLISALKVYINVPWEGRLILVRVASFRPHNWLCHWPPQSLHAMNTQMVWRQYSGFLQIRLPTNTQQKYYITLPLQQVGLILYKMGTEPTSSVNSVVVVDLIVNNLVYFRLDYCLTTVTYEFLIQGINVSLWRRRVTMKSFHWWYRVMYLQMSSHNNGMFERQTKTK